MDTPKAWAARLPNDLRTFKPSPDPEAFRTHLASVAEFVGSDDLALPVMNAAGLSVADWYRAALEATA